MFAVCRFRWSRASANAQRSGVDHLLVGRKRFRLNRGDRQINGALHRIAITANATLRMSQKHIAKRRAGGDGRSIPSRRRALGG